ncbi:MAG: type VI secretion system Vgr family protein [Pseudomonas sp.]
MAVYTQTSRPMRVDTVLGPEVLLIKSFTGHEAVSQPYLFELDLASEKDDIKAKDMLRTAASVSVKLHNGETRVFHGLIRRFTQHATKGDLTFYRAEVVPWFWFLSISRNCKIFQNLTVVEIVEKIFKDLGYADYEIRCTRSYNKREYCVQYRETNLDFVSRLLEEEGIFYFFKHEASKHTMVLADNNSSVALCPGVPEARIAEEVPANEDVILDMSHEHSVHLGKVTLAEYDYLQPSLNLLSQIEGEGPDEAYDNRSVLYTERDHGVQFARLRLEAEEATQLVVRGTGTCKFQSGFRFNLKDHYRADLNQAYMILEVRHSASGQEYRSTAASDFSYESTFVAMPHSIPFRPRRTTEKPVLNGSQTALVVGKKGEEIWVDKHGRVKVQFHWDRDGKKDEKSSCWVRVASLWAGKAWGAVHIPRIGQEVVVDFLEGDPDRPLIVGSVYNAEQVPPYTLPDNGTQSGLKSRSSKGGGTENFNEIRIEDKKGSELIFIYAEKDQTIEVEKDEKITIGQDRTEEVKRDEKITIQGKRVEEVKGTEEVTITGKRTTTLKNKDELTIDQGRTTKVKAGDDKLDVTNSLEVTTQQKIVLKANTEIELKVGSSTLKITPASIELKATQVKIEGVGMLELKAPMIKGEASAVLQLKGGGMAELKSDGVLIIKGSITMIN